MEALKYEVLQDEAIKLFQWEPVKSISLILLLSFCLTTGISARIAIIWYIKNCTVSRPINASILMDQVLLGCVLNTH